MMKSLQRILYVGLLVVTSAVMADTISGKRSVMPPG